MFRDTLNGLINDMELTEDEAFGLVHDLANRYGWATSIWSMGDVTVYPEGEDPSDYAGLPLSDDEADLTLTDAMRHAVTATWEWRKGLNEIASERVQDMIPEIEVHPDGSFTLHASGDRVEYTADGGTP